MSDSTPINKIPVGGGNSYRQRNPGGEEAGKKITPVTNAEVRVRKPSIWKRIRDTFVGDDIDSVGDYLLFEVAIPAAKDLVADMFHQSTDRLLYGDGYRRSSRSSRSNMSRVNYNRISSNEPPRRASRSDNVDYEVQEFILDSRAEAQEAVDQLKDLIVAYESATVADLREILNLPANNHVDTRWGWTSPHYMTVGRARGGGYFIDVPKPVPLGR